MTNSQSKIKKIITELCQKGVEWMTLNDVCLEISAGGDRPKNYKKGQTKSSQELPYPIFSNGTDENALYGYSNSYKIDKEAVTISARGTIGYHTIRNPKFTPIVRLITLIPNNKLVSTKFLNYILDITEIWHSGGCIPQLTTPNVKKIKIPIPHLALQEAIVKILDTFTELEAKLEAKLEAELEARNKQYEYYRKSLLSFGKEVEWLTLDDISIKVSSGGTPLKSKVDYYNGNIPWLRTQEVVFEEIHETAKTITGKGLKNSSAKWIPANCVIVAISGATAGRSGVNKIPLTTNQHCCNFEINSEKADYRYVFYWVNSQYEEIKSKGRGARSDLNAQIIKNHPIPIPPLSEQQRIVTILDKFDALTSDISIGLPAELKARRQQYEYYRSKLLTFKEKEYAK